MNTEPFTEHRETFPLVAPNPDGTLDAAAWPVLMALPEAVAVLDPSGHIRFLNPTAESLLGQPTETLRGRLLHHCAPLCCSASEAVDPVGDCLRNGRRQHWDDLFLQPGNTTRRIPVSISVAPLATAGGGAEGCVVLLRDMSRHYDRVQELTQQANHDALTGLPNRTLFRDRVQQAILYVERFGDLAAVLFIDLDDFKAINDTHGHPAGDRLLETVACRLENCLRKGDSVSRYAGDEFTVLLSQVTSREGVARATEKVHKELARPVWIGGRHIPVSSSIGVAVYPGDGDDPDALMHKADEAMYVAKRRGKNGHSAYTSPVPEDCAAS